MRGLRSTAALLVVLIGLGAYIYYVTWKEPEAGSGLERVFAALEADDFQELTVKSESGDVTTVQKQEAGWRIVDPVMAPASESEITSLISALTRLEVVRVIDENPPDPGEYGLATPRIEVAFQTVEGKPSGRILIGDRTPTGGNLYARRDDQPRVFLIESYQDAPLNRSTFELRDKTLLKVERDRIDRLEVSAGRQAIEFAKAEGTWRLARPVAARADIGLVEGLVSRLGSAQMTSVVTEQATPADLKKYGLASPAASVVVGMGGERAELVVGNPAEGGGVYARNTSSPVVATMDDALLGELKKGAEDYRRRDVFEFRTFNATRAEFTRGDRTVVFERVKPAEGAAEGSQDSWRRVSPNPSDVDRTALEGLLNRLADLRATSFTASAANTGLAAPAMIVHVTFDEGRKDERVTFGRSGGEVYCSRTDEPGAAKIDTEQFDEAIKALDELSS
jgi:hypothetical protein